MIKRLSPSVDTTGDGVADGSITQESLTYSLSGSVVSGITQQAGITGGGQPSVQTDFAFQPGGLNKTTEVVAGKTTTHNFSNGVYSSVQDPAGNNTAQSTNAQYRPDMQIDANGNAAQMNWSLDGKHLQQIMNAQREVTNLSYNSNDEVDSIIDAEGRKTKFTYSDANYPHLPTRIQFYDKDGTTILRWSELTYNSDGRVLTEKQFDPSGVTVQQQVNRSYYTSGNGNGLLQTLTRKECT